MMEQHRGYWIYGKANMVYPFDPRHYPAGTIFKAGRVGSVIEVARLQDKGMTFDMAELAEWYGMELCRIAVDEGLIDR